MCHPYVTFLLWLPRRFGTLLKAWEETRSRGRNQTKDVLVAAGYLIKFWWIAAETRVNVATRFKQENAFHAFATAPLLSINSVKCLYRALFHLLSFSIKRRTKRNSSHIAANQSLAQNWNRSDFPAVKAKFTVYYFTWKKWVKVCSRHCSITVHEHVISARLAMTNDVQHSITCMPLIQISD